MIEIQGPLTIGTVTILEENNIKLRMTTWKQNSARRFFIVQKINDKLITYLQSDGTWSPMYIPDGWYLTFDEALLAVRKAKELNTWNV